MILINSIVSCYGRYYLFDDYTGTSHPNKTISIYNSSWSKISDLTVDDDWEFLVEMNGKLYTLDDDLDILIELSSSEAKQV